MNSGDIDYFNTHLGIMLDITGMTNEEFFETRRYPTSYYRAMLAMTMRSRGLSTADIGTLLNRDHSTVTYVMSKLDSALSNRGYVEVKRVWHDYREAVAQLEGSSVDGRVPSIVDMARDFVGHHCNRKCRFCRIKRSECRYLQDERIFLAGAQAQRSLLREAVEKVETITAPCSMLCGKEGMKEVFAGLDDALVEVESNFEENV